MRRALALLVAALPAIAAAAEPRPLARGDWAALTAAHAGRPAVVHFWGVTCGPCLAELPQWHAFAARRRDLDLVMVDADPPAVAPEDIVATLDRAGLGNVESWRFADADNDRLEYEIDPRWHGELPYTLLIGRDGKVEPILGAVDFATLERWSHPQ